MVETKRQKSKWRMMLSAMGLATVLMASAAHAETSVSVVSGGVNPNPVECGQSFGVTFTASLNGKPGTGAECTANNVTWSWTTTVSGPDGSHSYVGNGASTTVVYMPGSPGTYSISATATASYESSAECGGNGSKSGSGSDSVEAIEIECPEG